MSRNYKSGENTGGTSSNYDSVRRAGDRVGRDKAVRMRILFIHQNFPGQYLHIARELAAQGGHQLVSLSIEEPEYRIEGVMQIRYGINRYPW
jgi:hypothetical protein